VKVGDLIVDCDGQLGIILTEPRLAEEPEMHGDEYYLIDVQFPKWIESVATDEVEIISASR
jgi:hypothetical protein